jgi:hypothetical protein
VLSMVEDRAEDQCKGAAPRRSRRTENVTLTLISGCALSTTRAGSGCDTSEQTGRRLGCGCGGGFA